MSLASHFQILESLLPLLTSYRTGKCCKDARMGAMSTGLKDLFELLNINSINNKVIDKEDLSARPELYLKELSTIILEDYSLSPAQKIRLQKLL